MLVGFDGTWNDEHPKPGVLPSNVRRFGECYSGDYIYEPGIGNDDDYSFIMQMWGGATGWGGRGIVRDACMKVGKLVEQGKKALLDVVGFSRGSALALHFANTVTEHGVPLSQDKRAGGRFTPSAALPSVQPCIILRVDSRFPGFRGRDRRRGRF